MMVETFVAAFQGPVAIAEVPQDGLAVHRVANDDERAAVAEWLAVPAVGALSVEGLLTADPTAGKARFAGRVVATITQTCVVTLAPVETAIDAPVERLYQAGLPPIDDDGDEAESEESMPPWAMRPLIDPLDGGIVDPLQAALEELALAVPAYPRASDAVFDVPPVEANDGAEGRHPFAALARLRQPKGDT